MGEGTIDERAFITGHLLLEASNGGIGVPCSVLSAPQLEYELPWAPLSIHWLYCSKKAITTLTIEGSSVGHHAAAAAKK
jgi:hypothetical protein